MASSDGLDRYTMKQRLSNSSWLVVNTVEKNKLCVCKKLPAVPLTAKQKDEVVIELQKLVTQVQHPYIINIEDIFWREQHIYVVTEYAEGGSLQDTISRASKEDESLIEIEVMDWFIQLTLGLQHLHKQGFVVEAFGPRDVYLKGNRAKLGVFEILKKKFSEISEGLCGDDFATAQTSILQTDDPTRTSEIHHTAPEVLEGKDSTSKSDMWTLGTVLYEMCAQRPAFSGSDQMAVVRYIIQMPEPKCPDNYSQEVADLCQRLLQREPQERLSTEELLELPFVQSHLKEMEQSFQSGPHVEDIIWEDTSMATIPCLSNLTLEAGYDSLELDSEDEREILTGRRQKITEDTDSPS